MTQALRILIIKDSLADIELICKEITHCGIEFTHRLARTRQEYFDALHAFYPEFIISGYNLEQLKGEEIIKMRQEYAPNIPFILLTPPLGELTAVECMKAGIDDYLTENQIHSLGEAIHGILTKRNKLIQKQDVESILKVSEERYRSLFENSAVPIFEEDFSLVKVYFDELKAQGVSDFRLFFDAHPEEIVRCTSLIKITDINQESLRFFQAESKEAIIEEEMMEGFLDESWAFFKEEIIALAEGKTYFECEFPLSTFTWEHKHVILKLSVRSDSLETLKHVLISFVDITPRKLAEAALAESEELFRSASENTLIGVCMMDIDGFFTFVNLASSTLLGYQKEELLNLSIWDIIVPEEQERFKENLNQMLSGSIPHITLEQRYMHKDGSTIWALVSTGIMHSTIRRKDFFVSYIHDISEQKEAELTIRKSAELYCTLTENMKDVIWILDPDTGKLIYVSPSSSRMTGYTPEELMEHPFESIFPAEYGQMLNRDMQKVMDDCRSGLEKPGTYHSQIIKQPCKNGSFIWAEISVYAYYNEETGKYELRGVHRDITEKQQAEERILKSEEKFRLLAENASDVIWTMDITGKNTYISPSVFRMRGFTQEEALHQGMKDSIAPGSVEIAQQFMNDSIEKILNGDSFESQNLVIEQTCKDGSTIWVDTTISSILDEEGKFVNFLGVSRNITDKKIAEEQLRDKQFWLGESQRVGKIGSYIYDILEDKWSSSEVLDMIFGFKQDSKKSLEAWISIVHPDDQEMMRNYLIQEVVGERKPFRKEYRIRRVNDKMDRWVLGLGELSYNQEGIPVQMIGTIQDITDQKIAEIALIAAKERAEENDRLKTAFLNNISHEIRTPMNAIIGFSGFLDEPNLAEEKRKYFTEIICNASNQLLSIISDIINIATIEAGQEKLNNNRFNINQLLRNLYNQFHIKTTSQQIELFCTIPLPDNDTYVDSDEIKLLQVLSNLINNAIKFTRQGYVSFGYAQKGNGLEFFVEDTGIGIPENMHTGIFDRFRQADSTIARQYGGTGLGLSISKAYVELLGGTIWLRSTPGSGSTFFFNLPLSIERNGHANPLAELNNEFLKIQKGKTVLVAEDEDFNYLLFQQLLGELDIILVRAMNGEEAVNICRSNPDINLVLMDVKMPIMDGYEATKIIKSFRPELPVIMQTAYARESDKIKAISIGCDAYLSKPIDIDEFLKVLKKFLDFSPVAQSN